MDTKKFIIIIVIVIAVAILLVKFLPKKADTNTGGGNTGGDGGNGGNGNIGGGSTKNYDASTWRIGDTVYASEDTPVSCTSCWLPPVWWTPDWLLETVGNKGHFSAGESMGTFKGFSGSIVTTEYNGETYLAYISNHQYTLRG